MVAFRVLSSVPVAPPIGIEESMLNATKTAACNSFEQFIGAPNVDFSPVRLLNTLASITCCRY